MISEPVTADKLAEALKKILKNKSVDVLWTRTLLASYDAQRAAEAQECTGVAAAWCPRCGDCTCCDSHEFTSTPNDKCPLHGLTSTHADAQQTEVSKHALVEELQRTKDELAKVIKAYDSAMVRLSEEVRRRTALNREDRIPGPSKPALSEVERAAVNVANAYHGCGDGAHDAHSLPDAVFTLRDTLKRIGAL